jgi:hypothetical protein
MRKIPVLLAVLSLLAAALASPVTAVTPHRASLTATPLTPSDLTNVAKSASGRLAKTDPALLGLTGSKRISVMVKLDYDAVASYGGGVDGLAATSPQVTGKSLKNNKKAVDAYLRHAASFEKTTKSAISAKIGGASFGDSFRLAYGGVRMTLPQNQIANLLKVDGVAAVQQDTLRQPLDLASPEFVGATKVWPQLGGSSTAGEGVIVGLIDTGVWPEHPMFADPGIPTPAGGPWACDFGDGSDPLLGPAFACNDKLIGAYALTDGYLANSDAEPGEFCNNDTGVCSARDSEGHGTHTATTAAGSPVDHSVMLGVDRGPVSGIAPGASVIEYRVCLAQGCFGSDSVAAVQQAIEDGVNVINFSISGGGSAYTDPVELAFLDAYAAGISVNASAGNSGPGAGTSDHAGPWVTTVGASTLDRSFQSTLNMTADNGDTFTKDGVTVTDGIDPHPVVLAQDVPGYDGDDPATDDVEDPSLCAAPFAAGSVDGLIVACARGVNARIAKGYNALQGGAAGFILYNPTASDVESDNHWLPAIHLEGPNDEFVAFITDHTGVMASWAPGNATQVRGDVMAGFSSRGPLGDFLKPDITAPGVQILAGNTPQPTDIVNGPPGELYQAIAGTSMSSPHAAGVSALVKAAHPDWSPGQIKSALMTSSVQDVLKEDASTPADPFDMGAGSIRADRAVSPTVTFDVSADDYFASAADPLGRVDLNLPSIYANPMPGAIHTTRTLKNVSGVMQHFSVNAKAPAGASIKVTPSKFNLNAGASQTIQITIDGTNLADGFYFGQITLKANRSAVNAVLPVVFNKEPGVVELQHSCDPTTLSQGNVSECSVTATNFTAAASNVALNVTTNAKAKDLAIQDVGGPGIQSGNGFTWTGTLSPALAPTIDSITAANGNSPGGGYLPLGGFGIPAQSGFGDETIANFNVPAFKYGDEMYTSVGVDSNGYVVVGGGSAEDNNCCEPQTMPDPVRPNNVLAPYWTDLSLDSASGGGAIRVGILTDQVTNWLIVEWDKVQAWDAAAAGPANSFQVWIQLGDTEGQWFTYGAIGGPTSPLSVGAENRDGSSGVNLDPADIPTSPDWTITTSAPKAGGSVTIPYEAYGKKAGTYTITATLTADTMKAAAKQAVTLHVTK